MAKGRRGNTEMVSTSEMVADGGAYHANALRLNGWWRLFLAEEIAAREGKLRGRTVGRTPDPLDPGPGRESGPGPTGSPDLAWEDYNLADLESPALVAESGEVVEAGPALVAESDGVVEDAPAVEAGPALVAESDRVDPWPQ